MQSNEEVGSLFDTKRRKVWTFYIHVVLWSVWLTSVLVHRILVQHLLDER